jgi:hypothetical protein
MAWGFNTHGAMRNDSNILVKKFKDLDIDWKIILEWLLEIPMWRLWTGLM